MSFFDIILFYFWNTGFFWHFWDKKRLNKPFFKYVKKIQKNTKVKSNFWKRTHSKKRIEKAHKKTIFLTLFYIILFFYYSKFWIMSNFWHYIILFFEYTIFLTLFKKWNKRQLKNDKKPLIYMTHFIFWIFHYFLVLFYYYYLVVITLSINKIEN